MFTSRSGNHWNWLAYIMFKLGKVNNRNAKLVGKIYITIFFRGTIKANESFIYTYNASFDISIIVNVAMFFTGLLELKPLP